MEHKAIIDWFAFSVRPDPDYIYLSSVVLDKAFVAGLLDLSDDDFMSLGKKVKYYKEMFVSNGISINVPFDDNADKQGYFVSFTGAGCRYYEQVHGSNCWKVLFSRIKDSTKNGLSINISRLDIAVDDIGGSLDINKIRESVFNGDIVSRFQRKQVITGSETFYKDSVLLMTDHFHSICGQTVQVGSRESRSMVRFYDKKAEQIQKFFAEPEKVEKLRLLPSWVRMEFEFKHELAIEMVNAYIKLDNFMEFFSVYVNGMVRFIDHDDSNVTRCTVKSWWLKFVGTLNRCSLSIGEFKPLTRQKHLDYVHRHLSGSVAAAMALEGVDTFLDTVLHIAIDKMSKRHQMLINGTELELQKLCSAELWEVLSPKGIEEGRYIGFGTPAVAT